MRSHKQCSVHNILLMMECSDGGEYEFSYCPICLEEGEKKWRTSKRGILESLRIGIRDLLKGLAFQCWMKG